MSVDSQYKWLRTLVLLTSITVLNNCKDPILLRSTPEGGIFVVNGKVSTQPGPYTVTLGYTSPDGRKPTPVPGGAVSLVSSAGNTWAYTEANPGEYVIPDGVAPILPGVTYHLEITLGDGRHYYSEDETVPMLTGTSDPHVEFEHKKIIVNNVEIQSDVANVFTDSQLPASGGPQFFKWDVGEVYMFEQTPIFNPITGSIPNPCFVTGYSDPQRINLFSTENLKVDHVDHKLVAVRLIDQSFLAKHYFIVSLSSISRKTYTYWDHVNSLVNRTGSIFDTPPAPIVGNIHNREDDSEKVYGYFEATNTSIARVYTLRGDIPFQLPAYCNDPALGVYYPNYPNECHNCLLIPGSSAVAPEWF